MTDSRLSARALDERLGVWRTRTPAYEALADAIRLLCLDNRIAPDTALPAERELAVRLRVSRSTVASAYAALRASGTITSVRGSGSVTRALGARPAPFAGGDGFIDLQQASPAAWPGLPAVYASVVPDIPCLVASGGYDTFGRRGLREAVARRFADRGLATDPAQIMITNGAQSAISMVARLLVSRGDRVLIETPTYPHAADTFAAAGARLVGIPVAPGEGWDGERADDALRRVAPVAAYLMPDFQNPTGESMTDADAQRIMDGARAAGTTLVIDETTSELGIDGGAAGVAFAARIDGGDEVITLGSLGKTVWGGLRIGWIRADEETIRRLVMARPTIDLGTPELEQAVAERLIPLMPEIIASRATQLRASRDALGTALAEHLPGWRVRLPAGGVAAWIGLGAARSSALTLEAYRRGVLLSAGPRFSVGGGHERFLRVPFTSAAETLRRAVAVLADSWAVVVDGDDSRATGVLVDAVV